MEIRKNYPLREHNTFGLDVQAKYCLELNGEEDLVKLIGNGEFKNEEWLILGEGSDILFTGDFNGLVILNCITGIRIIEQTDDHVLIEVKGGENWHDLVRYTVENGWSGIENLSLIPGTVGAAPMQNIGAYGVEIKDTLVSLSAIDLESGIKKIFSNSDCQFDYRDSIFKRDLKGKYLIDSIILKLNKKHEYNLTYQGVKEKLVEMGGEINPCRISDAIIAIRRAKLPDPEEIGNAGSFFKNPVVDKTQFEQLKKSFPEIRYYKVPDQQYKIPAAWLIDQCGWKGKRIGQTGTFRNQALVLVNYGQASGMEIYQLSKDIQKSVLNKFGIQIHPEVNII